MNAKKLDIFLLLLLWPCGQIESTQFRQRFREQSTPRNAPVEFLCFHAPAIDWMILCLHGVNVRARFNATSAIVRSLAELQKVRYWTVHEMSWELLEFDFQQGESAWLEGHIVGEYPADNFLLALTNGFQLDRALRRN